MNVAFVTGSRSDWRLVEPLLCAARDHTRLSPTLLVTGAHLSPRHGQTLDEIVAAGWTPAACVPILEDADSPAATARATGRAVQGLADALAAQPLEWVVVTGDRYESAAAALAASMLAIPLAHVGGGETDLATNQDGCLRNAMTKLAHVHFVAHALAERRVLALGEEPWRVRRVGLPSLDGIEAAAAPRAALEAAGHVPPGAAFLLVNYLPVTLHPAASLAHLQTLLGALAQLPELHKLIVLSNADAAGDQHDALVRRWAATRSDTTVVPALPPALYLAALRDCVALVGNSSSAVIEAPCFGTPVVIVGNRQAGRPAAVNVRTLPNPTSASLAAAVRAQLRHGHFARVASPYGRGPAAQRICDDLVALRRRMDLLHKRLIVPRRARNLRRAPVEAAP